MWFKFTIYAMETLEKKIINNELSQNEDKFFDEKEYSDWRKEITEERKITKQKQYEEWEELKHKLKEVHDSADWWEKWRRKKWTDDWWEKWWDWKWRRKKWTDDWWGKWWGWKWRRKKWTEEILPMDKKNSLWNKLKTFRNSKWWKLSKLKKEENNLKEVSLKEKKDLSLLPEYKKYKKIFEEIIEKLMNWATEIRDKKYFNAMQRWFYNSVSPFKWDILISHFNKLLENKDYEIVIIDKTNFKIGVKWPAEYCKLVNKKTWEEKKIIVCPSIEPIMFEK